MRGSKSKLISSLFRSSTKSFSPSDSKSAATTATSTATATAAKKLTLAQLFPIIDSSSDTKNTSSTSEAVDKQPKQSSRVLSKSLSRSRKPPPITARENSGISWPSESQSCSSSDGSEKALLNAISSILGVSGSNDTVSESCSLPASEAPDDQNSVEKVLDIPWFSNTSQISVSQRRKELSRERKQKWVFKTTQNRRFDRLVTMCGDKLGAKTTLEVFGRLGRETGLKEYNALIRLCIEKAKTSQEEEVSLDHVHKAFQLLKAIKEQGFQLGEETYRPILIYLIDMEMVEEFQFFSSTMKDDNPATLSRLGYYEMLLWARVDNKDKIQELFNGIGVDSDGGTDRFDLAESYLLALCETDRMEEVLQLLDIIDVTKVSSLDYLSSIFKSLGRRSMENSAEKFILALKNSDAEAGAENLSLFICNYITSMPNLAVEDAILKFKRLHEKLDVTPTSRSYAMLVAYFCDLLKVHAALDVVEQMSQLGFSLSVETFQHIVRAVEESCELDLVHPVYSMMHNHNLKPGCETFRSMINMCVRMKDFEGAYNMLTGLTEMDIMPTANMYNAIMAGYFREKNIHSALMVLNQMKKADVKPDSQTFSYLIGNSECEEDIVKYYDEMQSAGIQATKYVYMSLINAYVNLGQFQKAKQVLLDQGVPVKFLSEVKSVLVQALASHGQMSEALEIYEGIKQDKSVLDPKAAISLIEHVQCEGELDRLLQLLGELTDPDMWFDGCGRVILYCVRYKHLSSAVDLLKKLKDKDEMSMDVVIVQVFSQIWEAEPPALDIGLDLLKAIKEEVGLRPSRTILDFLLSACVTAKDLHSAWLIWEEYSKAGMLCNVLTFLRMYQVLLASGDYKAAKKMLKKIPKDDTHVRRLIQECQATFLNSVPVERKKK